MSAPALQQPQWPDRDRVRAVTRDLEASEWKAEVPNLPKGEYVAFVYQTVFANGHPQVESVVMVHEGNAWKMVGYAVD